MKINTSLEVTHSFCHDWLLFQENAHFGISDVLISVFEQMKWETSLRTHSCGNNTSEEEESDDEINELKQRIRIRRRERLVEVHTAILLTLSFNCMYITSVIYAISLPLLLR